MLQTRKSHLLTLGTIQMAIAVTRLYPVAAFVESAKPLALLATRKIPNKNVNMSLYFWDGFKLTLGPSQP